MCPKCVFQGSFYEIVEAAQTGIVGQVEPTLNIQAREALWSCLFTLVSSGIMLLLCGLPGTKHCRQPWF